LDSLFKDDDGGRVGSGGLEVFWYLDSKDESANFGINFVYEDITYY
jgi:hypothetical protein